MRPPVVHLSLVAIGIALLRADARATTIPRTLPPDVVRSAPSEYLEPYVGAYLTDDGGVMAMCRISHADRIVYLFTDFDDGWRGFLPETTGEQWFLEQADGSHAAALPNISVDETSGRRNLRLHTSGQPIRVGRYIDVTTAPVAFRNADVLLKGELFLPPGDERHPGMVFVHDAGPSTRDDFREWAYYFAANGIVSLVYDKRGTGLSNGDWHQATFDDLANDVVAGSRMLRGHYRVDGNRVGACGLGQGAWIVPLAASIDPEINFVVLVGGGGVSPAVQETYRRGRMVADAGYSNRDVETAMGVLDLYFRYLRSSNADPALVDELRETWASYAEAPWFPVLDIPEDDPTVGTWSPTQAALAREINFNPEPSVARIDRPVLVLIGAEDEISPTTNVLEAYGRLLAGEPHDVIVIDGADHELWSHDDPRRGPHQSPDVFRGIARWVSDSSKAATLE